MIQPYIKRPLFITLIFLCFGIITGMFFTSIFNMLLPMVAILCFLLYKSYSTKLPLLFLGFYIVGYLSIQNSLKVQNYEIETHVTNRQHFIIEGQVTSFNKTATNRQRLTLRSNNFYVSNTKIYQNMNIQAILNYGEYAQVGQKLRLYGNLLSPRPPSVPGGFNQLQFLRTRNIQYTIFPNNVYFGTTYSTFNSILHNFRSRLISVFENNLPPNQAAIMKSMVLGDMSSMDADVLDAFRAAGLYHILVVSGLHISILMLAINKLLDKFFPIKISALITLGIIILYAVMVGGVSIARACTMAGVMVFAKVLDKERDFITSISFAALCLLILQPLFLFDVGFLLSFGAVYGIAIGTAPIERLLIHFFRIPLLNKLSKHKNFTNSFAVTIAVFLTISPILAYFFYYIMPYSIIANIIVILSGKIMVILGFTVAFIGLFLPSLSYIFSGGLYFLSTAYESVAIFFDSMPGSRILIGRPTIIQIIGYYLVLGSLFLLFSNYKPKPIYKTYFATCLSIFSIIILLGMGRNNGLRVTFLDVGQGESIVITLNNQTYIIDGGGQRHREIGRNTGVSVLIPYLEYRGINHINAVFVTHDDRDHIAGIIELLNYSNKKVEKIYTTIGLNKDYELSILLLEGAERENIPVSFIHGKALLSSANLVMEILYPFYYTVFRGSNSTSLVMRLTYNNVSFLFTADIDQISERSILKSDQNVSAHVLNVSHHGSRFSSYSGFIDQVAPLVAIVSAGANNPFGHPAREVIDKFEERNIPIYNTATSGTIIVTTNGDYINITEMR